MLRGNQFIVAPTTSSGRTYTVPASQVAIVRLINVANKGSAACTVTVGVQGGVGGVQANWLDAYPVAAHQTIQFAQYTRCEEGNIINAAVSAGATCDVCVTGDLDIAG